MARRRPVALILAAGAGSRMGGPKALVETPRGDTLLERVSAQFERSGCRAWAVIGAQAAEVALRHPGLRLVRNTRWRSGQFSSVKAGLRKARASGSGAVLIHPVDIPSFKAGTVQALLGALEGWDAVVPVFRGARGHPLVLSGEAAERILQMRQVPHLEAALERLRVHEVAVPDPGVARDVDTWRDYRRVFGVPGRGAR